MISVKNYFENLLYVISEMDGFEIGFSVFIFVYIFSVLSLLWIGRKDFRNMRKNPLYPDEYEKVLKVIFTPFVNFLLLGYFICDEIRMRFQK